MSHFGTHAHRSRLIFPSKWKESDLRFELGASKATWSYWFKRDKAFAKKIDNRTYAQVVSHNKSCNFMSNPHPKYVPNKPPIQKVQHNSSDCVRSRNRTHLKRPLHNKCLYGTAPVLVNNRFEVLASHTDTSDAVPNETPVNKTLRPQYRVNIKHNLPSASSDTQSAESDPVCQVPPSDLQVSKTTGPVVRIQNDELSSKTCVDSDKCTDNLLCSREVNTSLFSQPNAPATFHSLDLKADVGLCESTYSNTAIPLNVWNNRFQCIDYQRCVQQNGFEFGAVPLTPIKLYEGGTTNNQPIIDIIQLHNIVRQSNCPNFLGCRIPVQTQLKPTAWRQYLQDYWDHQLPDLIEYGFPIDFDRSRPLISTEVNHASGNDYGNDIEQYLREEVAFNAIYGPFQEKPIHMHISPMMTREKQGSDNRRTIVDLSWPCGYSINDGVYKNKYLDSYYYLSYPSIDNIVNKLKKLGPGALIYKVDISRAFRHLRIDPGDLDLLGLKHDSYYLDGSLAFGFRHGSFFFQKCSDAIRFIITKFGYPNLLNYIDDLVYIGLPSEIGTSYQCLLDLLQELGLEISQKKLVAPCTAAICLGILVDSVNRTISIPDEKLKEIVEICHVWRTKSTCSKTQLQSLLGSLLYITKCVRPARFFLNRMLQVLRDGHAVKRICLTTEFHRDLNWFNTFLSSYNGVTFYDNNQIHATIALDACLSGLGAVYKDMVYALPIPRGFENYTIVHLEMLNIMVALKVWGQHWSNKCVEIKCDNLAVVSVLQEGKARDPLLATFARNIWLLTSLFNIQLKVSHIFGKDNQIADLLSRWWETKNNHQKLQSLLPNYKWVPTHIDLTKYNQEI